MQLGIRALLIQRENGNSFKPVAETTTNDDGTSTTIIPGHVTIEEKAKKKNDVKARNMLLMALPNEHLMTFNQYKDAKTLFDAIETRFGGKEATKKIKKTLLKQLRENFGASSTDPNSTSEVPTVFGVSTASPQKTGKKITINGSDIAGYDKSKVECFNCHKMEEFCKRMQSAKESGEQNQESRNHKKENSEIVVLKSKLEKIINDKNALDVKIRKFASASQSLDKLIGSQIIDNSKSGLGYASYNVVPPPHTGRFPPPIIDLSHIGLPEFVEPNVKSYRVTPIEVVTQSSSVKISTHVKENIGALLIEDWESDEEDEVESPPEKERKNVEPSMNKARCKCHQRERMVNGTNHSRVIHNATTVPKAMLTRTGFKPVNSVRPVNSKRKFFKKINTANEKVNTARPNSAVLNAVRANKGKAVKASECWVWRPIKLDNASIILKKHTYIDARGRSKHMTGNISYLTDFKEFDRGYVAFGGKAKGGKITGKGTIRTGKLDFKDVYFVKELQFNLFSVSQICDKKNSVFLTDTEFFVLPYDFKLADESHVLLKVPRKKNMYSVDMKNIVPKKDLTWVVAKATNYLSMFWHMRLGHINFKIINKLVKDNLVRGLPSKRFENNQTCVDCLKGKQHKVSFKCKIQNSISQPLFMLHMNLFGPTSNMVLVVKPHFKTPYELFRGRTHALSFMRPFGCLVTILNTLDHLVKFDGKSDEGFFVGYSTNRKAFRVYNTRTRKVEENLHIKFLENKPLIAERPNDENNTKDINTVGPSINTASSNINTASPIVNIVRLSDDYFGANDDMRSLDRVELDISNLSTTYHVPTTSNIRINKDHSLDNVIGDMQSGVQTRRMIVTTDKQGFISVIYEEKTYGCTQEEGIDYDKVFAPVARLKAIRIFLAYASFMGFLVYQMDVKSAFLYGRIEEEVYVCQPSGFEDPDYPDKVYKVEKYLYGLHQAPRACQDKYVDEILIKFKYADVKPASTPMNKEKALLKVLDGDDVDVHLYRSMIRYLKGHPKLGLWYPNDSSFDLVAYTNSDYAGASLERKSTSGGCQFLRSRLISWKCKKQTMVVTSTTEAEYVAAASCCGQKLGKQLNHKGRRAVIDSSDDAEPSLDAEDSLKQGMMIEELDIDENVNLVQSTKETARQEHKEYNLEKALELYKQLDERKEDKGDQARDIDWSDPSNHGGYKQSYFKRLRYEDIRPIFEKIWDQNHTFVPMDFEIEKEVMKISGFDLQQESSKKQNLDKQAEVQVDSDQEEDDMMIVLGEEISIDSIQLANKPLVIVEWKIISEGRISSYHIIRADGSSKRYTSMINLLKNIDREDLETLWRLVKAKYGDTRPKEAYKRVLWGNLKVMFEPDIKSEGVVVSIMRSKRKNPHVLFVGTLQRSGLRGGSEIVAVMPGRFIDHLQCRNSQSYVSSDNQSLRGLRSVNYKRQVENFPSTWKI
nr:ribonuclease H-like domain-containing protein [Tanacetum cinerariifolium]